MSIEYSNVHLHSPALKGYLCCKRRVLEFEEFLKIEGCKTGRHVFALKNQPEQVSFDHFIMK